MDQNEGLKNELKARDQVMVELTDKNKKLSKECQMMQERIMEEKSKVMEMMNAAMEMSEKCPRCNSKFGAEDDLMGFAQGEIRNSEVI